MEPLAAPNLTDLAKLIASAQADVVIVGGVAMAMRGADYVTLDFDVCYRREAGNIARLCRALAPHSAMLRSAFVDIQMALLTEDAALSTDYGRVDLMGAITGIGAYEQVAQAATTMMVEALPIRVLTLDGLIQAKAALLRDKDKLHLATLKALRALKEEQTAYRTRTSP